MLVSAGSISRQATSPSASSRSSAVEVVDLDHAGRLVHRDRRPDAALARAHLAVDERGDRLVDAAVVAVVVDDDLRAPGDLAGDPDHEPVRVGRREGELPVAQAEAALHLLADGRRVLGRQHRGDPAGELRVDRGDRRRRRVAGHRARVAEAEVGVDVAVDVAKLRALGRLHEHREVPRPAGHPVHRHPGEQRRLAALVQLARRGCSATKRSRSRSINSAMRLRSIVMTPTVTGLTASPSPMAR